MIKFLRIILLVIFFFPYTISYGAVLSFNSSESVGSEEGNATGLVFNPDGTKMYVVGFNDKIFEYALTTPFTVSTASYSSGEDCDFTSVRADDDSDRTQDLKFNSDGTAVFVALRDDGILKISLSTPYDVSTCDVAGRETHTVRAEIREISFSSDGSRFFTLNQIGTLYEVNEYSLSSSFNLNGMTLVKTQTNFGGNELRDLDAFAQALGFSSDGSKMFYFGNQNDKIHEFTLSPPYNISNATLEGSYDISANDVAPTGIAFNSDGLKMFITSFLADDHVSEYSLTCGFGVIKCIDPTSNPDDVASIESQSESARQLIRHTTTPVLNRMEWLRRNDNRVNLTNQNIKFQFNNEILNALSESLIPLYFASNDSSESSLQNSNWSFWSEGTISIGKIGETSVASSKDINTSAITFGADKKNEDNLMRGIALRFGNDDVDVGSLGSAIDMSTFSFTFYESRPRGENKFLDHLIGATFINSDLINNSGTISTKGERSGEQIYGSLSFRDTISRDKFNITPRFKVNYGLTHFGEYEETGSEGINLKFHDQFIGNFTTSLGTSLDNTYEFEVGSFIPYFDFEYYADMSPSTKQKFSYVSSTTSDSFTIGSIDNSTHNIYSGIGFDLLANNGFNLMTKYTRDLGESFKHDSFVVALDYRASSKSSYAMSMQDTSAKLSHNREVDGFNINLDSHYDFFQDDPEYGLYLKISNKY